MHIPANLHAIQQEQAHCFTAQLACFCCLSSRSQQTLPIDLQPPIELMIAYWLPEWLYLQTLSVAVHNHYKRVRHETSRRRLKEHQAATTAAAHGVPAFVQSGKVTRSILETNTGPGITPQSPLTGPHSQPHDRFPFPPTADAGTMPNY